MANKSKIILSDNKLIEQRIDENFDYYRKYSDKIESDRKIEENTSAEYKGRELLELLQNAADASKNREGKVSISLVNNILTVENSGNPFDIDGVRSLFSANFSTKRFNKNADFIGYKGLGFRSVLNFSNDIKIYSEKISIGYSTDSLIKFQNRLLKKQPEIIELFGIEDNELFLPFFSAPNQIPFDELSDGMSTKIVFKIYDNAIQSVKNQISNIGKTELLFNNSLKLLSLRDNQKEISIEIDLGEQFIVDEHRKIKKQIATIKHSQSNQDEVYSLYTYQDQIELYQEKKKKNEPKKYALGVAFPHEGTHINIKDNFLVSYFKTDIKNPFPFIINATFNLTADRNRLYKDDPLNKNMISNLNEFVFLALEKEYYHKKPNYNILSRLMIDTNLDFLSEDGYDFIDLFVQKRKTSKILPTKNEYKSLVDEVFYSDSDYYTILSKTNSFDDLLLSFESTQYPSLHLFLSNEKKFYDQQMFLYKFIEAKSALSREQIIKLSRLYFKTYKTDGRGHNPERVPLFFNDNDNNPLLHTVNKFIVDRLKGEYRKIAKVLDLKLVNEIEIPTIYFRELEDKESYDNYYKLTKLDENTLINRASEILKNRPISENLLNLVLSYFDTFVNHDVLQLSLNQMRKLRENAVKTLFPVITNNGPKNEFVFFSRNDDVDVSIFITKLKDGYRYNVTNFIDDKKTHSFLVAIGVAHLTNEQIYNSIDKDSYSSTLKVFEANKWYLENYKKLTAIDSKKKTDDNYSVITLNGETRSINSIYKNDRDLLTLNEFATLGIFFCDYKQTFGKREKDGVTFLEDKEKPLDVNDLLDRVIKMNQIEIIYKLWKNNKSEINNSNIKQKERALNIRLPESLTNSYTPADSLFFESSKFSELKRRLTKIKYVLIDVNKEKEFYSFLGVKELDRETLKQLIIDEKETFALPFLYYGQFKTLPTDKKDIRNNLINKTANIEYYAKDVSKNSIYESLEIKFKNLSEIETIYRLILQSNIHEETLINYLELIDYKEINNQTVYGRCIEILKDKNSKISLLDAAHISLHDLLFKKEKFLTLKIESPMYLPTIGGVYKLNSDKLKYLSDKEWIKYLKNYETNIVDFPFEVEDKYYELLSVQKIDKSSLEEVIITTNDRFILPYLYYVEYKSVITEKESLKNEIISKIGKSFTYFSTNSSYQTYVTNMSINCFHIDNILELFRSKMSKSVNTHSMTTYMTNIGFVHVNEKVFFNICVDILHKKPNNQVCDFAQKYLYEICYLRDKTFDKPLETVIYMSTIKGQYQKSSQLQYYLLDNQWLKYISKYPKDIAFFKFEVKSEYIKMLNLENVTKEILIEFIKHFYENCKEKNNLVDFNRFLFTQKSVISLVNEIDIMFPFLNQFEYASRTLLIEDITQQKILTHQSIPWINRESVREYFQSDLEFKETLNLIKFKIFDNLTMFHHTIEAIRDGIDLSFESIIAILKDYYTVIEIENYRNEIKGLNRIIFNPETTFIDNSNIFYLLKAIQFNINVILINPIDISFYQTLGINQMTNLSIAKIILSTLLTEELSIIKHVEKVNLLFTLYKNHKTDIKNIINQDFDSSFDGYLLSTDVNCEKFSTTSRILFGPSYGKHLNEYVFKKPWNHFLSNQYIREDNHKEYREFFTLLGVQNTIQPVIESIFVYKLSEYPTFKRSLDSNKATWRNKVTISHIPSLITTLTESQNVKTLEYIETIKDYVFKMSPYELNGKRYEFKKFDWCKLIDTRWIDIQDNKYKPSDTTLIEEYDFSPHLVKMNNTALLIYSETLQKIGVVMNYNMITIAKFYAILLDWKNQSTVETIRFYDIMLQIYALKTIEIDSKEVESSKTKFINQAKLLGKSSNNYGYYAISELAIVDKTITNHDISCIPKLYLNDTNYTLQHELFDIRYLSSVSIIQQDCVLIDIADEIMTFLGNRLTHFDYLFDDAYLKNKIHFMFLKSATFKIMNDTVVLDDYEYLIDCSKNCIYFKLPDDISSVLQVITNVSFLKIFIKSLTTISNDEIANTLLTILLLDENQISTYKEIKGTTLVEKEQKEILFELIKPSKRTILEKIFKWR